MKGWRSERAKVGHSAGAYYAQAMAARRPALVAGLALVCPLLPGVRDVPGHRLVAGSGCAAAVDLLDHYPHASLAVVDDAGHALPHEQPGLLRSLAGAVDRGALGRGPRKGTTRRWWTQRVAVSWDHTEFGNHARTTGRVTAFASGSRHERIHRCEDARSRVAWDESCDLNYRALVFSDESSTDRT